MQKHRLGASPVDAIIEDLSVNLARIFVEKHKEYTDPYIIDQVRFLKLLLFYNKWIDCSKYVSTREIIYNLSAGRSPSIRPRYIRSVIVAKLRDADVLVGSSSRGYKLPINEKDIIEFMNHTKAIVDPMVERVKKCHNRVLLATKKKLDVFDRSEFKTFKRLSDT